MLSRIKAWWLGLDRPLVYVHSYRDDRSIYASLREDGYPFPTEFELPMPDWNNPKVTA